MIKRADGYHTPVLLKRSVDGLDIKPDGVYIDATFGGGGHSREILGRLSDGGRLYGFDQDSDAEEGLRLEVGSLRLEDDKRFTFVRSNFRWVKNWMRYYGEEAVDGLIADLGVSSHHLDEGSRGFSFRQDAPLDMRMNRRGGLSAADVINGYEEEKIADILYIYGELKNSRKIARKIVKARSVRSITTTGELLQATEGLFAREREKKDTAKMFQALRIEVNHEMDALRDLLNGARDVIREGGRLVVITYHSLEDRIVKNYIRSGNAEGKEEIDFFGNRTAPFMAVNNKIVTPDKEEIEKNPRSRSAKMRIAEKGC